MKILKIAMPLLLAAAIPQSAYANKPTTDNIPRCNMVVPAPLTWFVAYIPCWAYAQAAY
jgi:hypothetical protein